jgi:acetyl-CoA carboxylase carboxyl transferase subunit alpha
MIGSTSLFSTWDHVQVARHPQRPHTLDYVHGLCRHFVELHGDRCHGDDAALVAGLARFNGRPVAVLGHQRGHNARENIRRNFGSPHPEGYRKALRIMQQAEKFSFPLLCFIDTPGACPDMASEERGQAQAIAANLLAMVKLEVPVVAVVIGEGGSGGALGIGVADRLLMLEHAVYSVASPEGTAAILWRDSAKAPDAARAMKITAQDLEALGITDTIIREPEGGAHTDTPAAIAAVGDAIRAQLAERALRQLTRLAADVPDDPTLPASREQIVRYWHRRVPQIVRNLDRG